MAHSPNMKQLKLSQAKVPWGIRQSWASPKMAHSAKWRPAPDGERNAKSPFGEAQQRASGTSMSNLLFSFPNAQPQERAFSSSLDLTGMPFEAQPQSLGMLLMG